MNYITSISAYIIMHNHVLIIGCIYSIRNILYTLYTLRYACYIIMLYTIKYYNMK